MLESKKSELTIGMPIYNNEKIIRNCLEKILSLPFTNFKLIISHDGPNKIISKMCKEYQISDKRIQYFEQENNIGSKNNFEFVLKKASLDNLIFPPETGSTPNLFFKGKGMVLNVSF